MKFANSVKVALFVFLGGLQAAQAQDNPYKNLLRRLPDSTNAVVAMDVKGMQKTLGADSGTTLATLGIASIPLTANKFVMGAQIDMKQRQHVWSITLAELDPKMSIEDIATAEGEKVEKLGTFSIVPSPRNAYFVEVTPSLLACRSPADRQQLKRWLGYQKLNQFADLTTYLTQAVNPKDPALMILAVDLTDNLDRSAVRRGLDHSSVMAGRRRPPDYEKVTNILTAAQGMTMLVTAGSPFNGQLTITFDVTSLDPISDFAKELFIEGLQKTGLFVRDFEGWQPYIGDNFIQISGPLTLHAMRKFGAMIKSPAPSPQAADMANYANLSPTQRTLQATQSYWKTMSAILEDLKTEKANTNKAQAGWYDQFAGQIDKIPLLNVDPDLVTFAMATSQQLRALSTTYTGISTQRGYLKQETKSNMVGFAPIAGQGYWGYSSGAQQDAMQENKMAEQGIMDRTKLWQEIDDATANIRRQLTVKYMVQFN
jgi:hypothetical protein